MDFLCTPAEERFSDYMHLEEVSRRYTKNLKLKVFDWSDLTNFDVELIEFQGTSVWCEKFVELRMVAY
jgi:hypothetical protein